MQGMRGAGQGRVGGCCSTICSCPCPCCSSCCFSGQIGVASTTLQGGGAWKTGTVGRVHHLLCSARARSLGLMRRKHRVQLRRYGWKRRRRAPSTTLQVVVALKSGIFARAVHAGGRRTRRAGNGRASGQLLGGEHFAGGRAAGRARWAGAARGPRAIWAARIFAVHTFFCTPEWRTGSDTSPLLSGAAA